MNALLTDLEYEYRRHKGLADKAIAPIDDDIFFQRPTELNNSVAHIVKHLAGNLRSRFTDFLTTDGDKPDRDRDSEFVITDKDKRADLLAAWEYGWRCVFNTFHSLKPEDLAKSITIRGEAHTVQQALLRGATHAAYHVGQILYLIRLLHPDGVWLTIAPGQSKNHTGSYFRKPS
jgi:uncharacterized damage-inducible protein DinB